MSLALISTGYGNKIIGLSCLEKSWMVAGIGVRHVRAPDETLNETRHDYQVV